MVDDNKSIVNDSLVSVIIVVRNGERFLAQAIESVLNSNYRPIEILVIDGQSEDKTAEIAQSYSLVRYVQQPSSGISEAYNLGIQKAKGEFVAFNSHDDVWTNDKLEVQVDYLTRHPDIQYVTAKAKFFIQRGCAIPSGFRQELLQGEHVCHTMETLMARKSLFDIVGAFNPQLSTAEDVDWFSRARDKEIPTYTIQKVLLYKRVHDENLSLHHKRNNQNLLQVVRKSLRRKHHHEGVPSRKAQTRAC